MKFDCWVQTADFATTEHNGLAQNDAVSLFKNCDWERMIQFELELAAGEREYAAPGFGVIHPEGHNLHICPDPDHGSCWMLYEPLLNRKFFGFIPRPDPCYESEELKFVDALVAIENFCKHSPVDSFLQFLQDVGIAKP